MKIGFALEYSLGHVTHAENLKRFIAADPAVEPVYVDIAFDATPMPALLRPVFKDNWSIRASLAARNGIGPHVSELSSCLFHTQITSLLSPGLMRAVPSVVSLDATPLQYDHLGAFYKHAPGPPALEALKKRLNERAFAAAARLVTWSQWAKDSLVRDYGVAAEKVTVIAPGIDLAAWAVEGRSSPQRGAVTFLFVGGDFERKGGATLLEAFRAVRSRFDLSRLLIVTKTLAEGFAEPGVEVFRGMTPNSPELRALYARADVFAFPTLGDCLPLAVMEALAAGLPVVTSNVGALGEAVTHGEEGLVVEPGDPKSLASAMARFCDTQDLRRSMSERARKKARTHFNAASNYARLIDLLKTIPSDACRNA